jgi:RNA polymerase primary sigma factor
VIGSSTVPRRTTDPRWIGVEPWSIDAIHERPPASIDPVRTYLNQIGTMALLRAEDEVRLAQRVEVGLYAERLLTDSARTLSPSLRADLRILVQEGMCAKNQLVEANLRLVVSLARRYTGRGMALLDLIQDGNLGLIRAVEKFDYTKGYKFSTYATWWIRQAMTRAMADRTRTVRIPVHIVEILSKIDRARRDLSRDLGREPSLDEIAKEVDLPAEKVLEIQRCARQPVSLDHAVGEDGDARLGDFIEDAEAVVVADVVAFAMLPDQLRSVLATLSEREAAVVRLRFGLADGQPRTLDEIGEVYGVSRERVRQIAKAALAKLRRSAQVDDLRDLLG